MGHRAEPGRRRGPELSATWRRHLTRSRRPTWSSRGSFVVAAASLVMVSFSAGVLAPMMPAYEAVAGISPRGMSASFATYISGAAVATLVCGRLPDVLGRRFVSLLGLGTSAAACLLFLSVHGTAALVLARGAQGLGVGIGMTALATFVLDLAPAVRPALGTLVASTASPFGTAVGALAAGMAMEWGGLGRPLVFCLTAGALAGCAALVWATPETTARRPVVLASLAPAVAFPGTGRRAFTGAAVCFVACWSLGGFYQSLGPSVARDVLDSGGPLAGGSVAASVMATAAFGGVATSRLGVRAANRLGAAALAVGLLAVVVAVGLASWALFLVASVVVGLGFGATISSATALALARTTVGERAGGVAALYLLGFVGAAVVTTCVGGLVGLVGYGPATIALGLSVAAGALGGAALLRR